MKSITLGPMPESRELTKKYVWYFPDNSVKTSENRRYVVKSCQVYLQRLSELVDECEKNLLNDNFTVLNAISILGNYVL